MSSPYNPAPDEELLPSDPPLPYQPQIPPPIENPPWTFLQVLLIAAFGILQVFFFQAFAIAIAHHRYPLTPLKDFAQNVRVVLPPQVLGYLGLLISMVLLLRSNGLHFWKSIRWNWPSSRWLGFVIFGVVLAFVMQVGSTVLPIPKELPIEHFFADTVSAYMLAIFGVTLAPLLEELYFRGFLYPVLARRLGMPVAVAITALSFALIHESQLAHAWGPLLLLFFVGIALTMARVHTGSVAASFLIHVGYNSTLFTVMYFVTDHFRHMEKMK